jgi:hypothetical protein
MAAPSIANTLTWAKVSPVPAGWWNAGTLTFDATVKAIVVTLSTSVASGSCWKSFDGAGSRR